MPWVMCCYQTFRHLLATGIYLRILNCKERKEVNLLLHLTSWPFEKTCVNSRTTSEVLSLFSMHCWEQWECYGRQSILCMLLLKVPEDAYDCLYSSNPSSFFGFCFICSVGFGFLFFNNNLLLLYCGSEVCVLCNLSRQLVIFQFCSGFESHGYIVSTHEAIPLTQTSCLQLQRELLLILNNVPIFA